MLPIIATGADWALYRIEELEQELQATRSLAELLASYIASRTPPDDPSSPLARYLSAVGDSAKVERIVTVADEHLKSGRRDKMILLLREETGARWDQLNRLADGWGSLTRDARRAWVRSAVLRKVLGTLIPPPTAP